MIAALKKAGSVVPATGGVGGVAVSAPEMALSTPERRSTKAGSVVPAAPVVRSTKAEIKAFFAKITLPALTHLPSCDRIIAHEGRERRLSDKALTPVAFL